MSDTRLIFYHKQNTSARLRFLVFESGSVCAFEPLPSLSQVVDECLDVEPDDTVVVHPAQLVLDAANRFGMAPDCMKVEGEYRARVDSCDGQVQIYLTGFTTIDPPFAQAQDINAQFIDLTQARGLPDVEHERLRRAYEHVMTG